jgi:hypothetical protein
MKSGSSVSRLIGHPVYFVFVWTTFAVTDQHNSNAANFETKLTSKNQGEWQVGNVALQSVPHFRLCDEKCLQYLRLEKRKKLHKDF